MKTKNKKILFRFHAILISLCLIGTSLTSCAMSGGHIEDTNGDSKELAVITDSDIQDNTYSSVMSMSSTYSEGYNTSGVIGQYREEDDNHSRLSAKKFSGVRVANVCRGNGKEVTYTIESTVSSGNFKIVILDEDHQILEVVPIDEKATVKISTEAGNLYFVTYAGESAEIKVELWRTMA